MSALAVPVVLVDDHQMVVLGLRTLFHNRPEIDVVAFANDAEQALGCVRAHRPRVVVLDVALEGSRIDGFELCRRLRAEHADVDVVFYTGVDELGLAERAFAVGAQGVVSKGDSAADLLKAVLLASRGRSYTSPAFAARADLRDFEDLSPKQLAALRLLAAGAGAQGDRRADGRRRGDGQDAPRGGAAQARCAHLGPGRGDRADQLAVRVRQRAREGQLSTSAQ